MRGVTPAMSSQKPSSSTAVLQAIRLHGGLSRSRLAEFTGLSRATISEITNSLLRQGWIEELMDGGTPSGKGRPATLLQLASNDRVMVGGELTDDGWALAAFDLTGQVLSQEACAVDVWSPQAAKAALIDSIDTLRSRYGSRCLPVLGLGLAGLVNTRTGVVESAADIGWRGVEFGVPVSRDLGWPTIVVNRHRARGLAECRYGAGVTADPMLYVGIGSGVAAGLYIHRQLFSGAHGGAGEIGHIPINPDGPPCPCGNRGCLQVLVSSTALVREVRRSIRDGSPSRIADRNHFDVEFLQMHDLTEAEARGDPLVRRVLRVGGAYLGMALAGLVNTFNPEGIVLGGSVPHAFPILVDEATQVMRQRAIMPIASKTCVQLAHLPAWSGALGAISYALDTHFTGPAVR